MPSSSITVIDLRSDLSNTLVNQVANYDTDLDADDFDWNEPEEVNEKNTTNQMVPKSKRIKQLNKAYKLIRVFNNESHAFDAIKLEKKWTRTPKYDSVDGNKLFFKCAKSKKCPVKLYLQRENEIFLIFKSTKDHVHSKSCQHA